MSVIKEFVMFSAGLVITVSLVMVSFGIYRRAAALGNGIMAREQNTFMEMWDYELTRFDGSEIDGSKAISYIRKVYAGFDVPITVTNGRKTFTVDGESIDKIRDSASDYYMNPMKKYKVRVYFDENDAANQITIEQKRG